MKHNGGFHARLHVKVSIQREGREPLTRHFYDVGVLAIEGTHHNQFKYDYSNFDVIPDAPSLVGSFIREGYKAKTIKRRIPRFLEKIIEEFGAENVEILELGKYWMHADLFKKMGVKINEDFIKFNARQELEKLELNELKYLEKRLRRKKRNAIEQIFWKQLKEIIKEKYAIERLMPLSKKAKHDIENYYAFFILDDETDEVIDEKTELKGFDVGEYYEHEVLA